MISHESILKLSASQGATCMYTKEELSTFSQIKLKNIYSGIEALKDRPVWRKDNKIKLSPLKRGRKKTKVKLSAKEVAKAR